MTTLVAMTADFFSRYLAQAIGGYAAQNVESGRSAPEEAMAQSELEHRRLLPQGQSTPDHYFFEIRDDDRDSNDCSGNITVGTLWVAVIDKGGVRSAYIYNIEIDPAYRRQGHAKRAFVALESFVETLGLSTIGLHVFAFNRGAQALYESLGYVVTGLNMQKKIRSSDHPQY